MTLRLFLPYLPFSFNLCLIYHVNSAWCRHLCLILCPVECNGLYILALVVGDCLYTHLILVDSILGLG